MSADETAASSVAPDQGSVPSGRELSHMLEQLHDSDVAQRATLLAAERAQDLSMRSVALALHDDVDQSIRTALGLLHSLRTEVSDDTQARSMTRVEEQLARAVSRLQRLIMEVRPPLLERQGLAATLRTFLEGVREESRLDFDVVDALHDEPPPEDQINLFRIAYEAIDNVRKYAHATSVRVEVRTFAGGFLVRVVDNGRGFDAKATQDSERLGSLIMSQRAELRDGWSQVTSTPGEGTTVEVWTPGVSRPSSADDGGERLLVE